LAALWLLAAAAAASAQSAAGNTILGKVRTQSGRPLANVLVEIQTGNGATITQRFTGNEGDYAFTGLAGASFVLVVNEPNHQPLSERVELTRTAGTRPGDVVRIDLTLVPKPAATSPAPPSRTNFSQNIPKPAQDELGRAMKLAQENKVEAAIAAMRESIKIFPDYFDAHFALGNELMKMNRFDEAIVELEHARSINPKDDRVFQTFGLVLMKQKKPAIAAAVFGEAFRLNPTDPQILLLRAIALLDRCSTIASSSLKETIAERERMLTTAEKELARANELSDGKLVGVHLQRARVYEKRGDRSRAADSLERYLKLVPDDKNAAGLREAIKKLRAPLGGEKLNKM
jgi:Tfp pilus assembly protein PilF